MRRAMLFNVFGQSDESLDVTDLLNSFGEKKLTQKAAQLDDKFYSKPYFEEASWIIFKKVHFGLNTYLKLPRNEAFGYWY